MSLGEKTVFLCLFFFFSLLEFITTVTENNWYIYNFAVGTGRDNDSSVTLKLTLGKQHCLLKNTERIFDTGFLSSQCFSLLRIQILGQLARKHYLIILCHWVKKKFWTKWRFNFIPKLWVQKPWTKRMTRRPEKDFEWCDLANECLGRPGPWKWRWCWMQCNCIGAFDAMGWNVFLPTRKSSSDITDPVL